MAKLGKISSSFSDADPSFISTLTNIAAVDAHRSHVWEQAQQCCVQYNTQLRCSLPLL
jgi:hypothetical protein